MCDYFGDVVKVFWFCGVIGCVGFWVVFGCIGYGDFLCIFVVVKWVLQGKCCNEESGFCILGNFGLEKCMKFVLYMLQVLEQVYVVVQCGEVLVGVVLVGVDGWVLVQVGNCICEWFDFIVYVEIVVI